MKILETVKKTIDNKTYEYHVYKLVSKDDPVLNEAAPLFDFVNPPMNPTILALSLAETMQRSYGVGLAANQIGLPYRAFALGSNDGQRSYINVLFNPEIVSTEGEMDFDEGCLTFKGLYLKVRRPANVNVKFQDYYGAVHEFSFSGLTARTFLHELDHLNGIVFTSKVNQYILERAKKHQPANIKKLNKQYEAQERNRIIQTAAAKVAQDARDAKLSESLTLNIPDQNLTY